MEDKAIENYGELEAGYGCDMAPRGLCWKISRLELACEMQMHVQIGLHRHVWYLDSQFSFRLGKWIFCSKITTFQRIESHSVPKQNEDVISDHGDIVLGDVDLDGTDTGTTILSIFKWYHFRPSKLGRMYSTVFLCVVGDFVYPDLSVPHSHDPMIAIQYSTKICHNETLDDLLWL